MRALLAAWRGKRWLRWTLRSGAYLLLLVMLLRWFEHSQIYIPSRNMDSRPGDSGHAGEEVWFEAKDKTRINAWFFPANAGSPRKEWVVLQCHGNAGNISHRHHYFDALLDLGVNVLAFDYRGYGLSEGRPSEEGTYLDAQAAYQWLRQKGFPAEKIVVLGESLGGGIASELAVREKVGGLILQSTFTSIVEVGAEFFPWLPVRWLATIHYNTLEKLPRVNAPVLVMHSRIDEIIPWRHGEKLFAAAKEPKLFQELSGGHNATMDDGPEKYREGINRLLELLERPR